MAISEKLAYHNYIYTPVLESQFVKGLMVEREDLAVMKCPNCNKESNVLNHGETQWCECGLRMQVWGNCLKIWK